MRGKCLIDISVVKCILEQMKELVLSGEMKLSSVKLILSNAVDIRTHTINSEIESIVIDFLQELSATL